MQEVEKDKFLVRRVGSKSRAHLWNGSDTACRMFSTGGMCRDRYFCVTHPGPREICWMCQSITDRMKTRRKFA